MEKEKEFLTNAEIAFVNKQYSVALEWYKKALEESPDNLYALSRAGAICVPMGRFKDALAYFGHAYELDPSNGDNAFNYANACFFSKDYPKALAMYTEAKKVGCSEDVTPRLYYQMALLCSIRQDIASALVYFEKCEESDKTGLFGLNPDLISERLKLYLVQKDYTNAEKCAAQLVAIDPKSFKNYMVYFSILMSHNRYTAAQTLLADARRYATLDTDNDFALSMQEASLYMAMADAEPEQRESYCEKAITILQDCDTYTAEQRSQALLATAESYCKMEKYDDAISILQSIVEASVARPVKPAAEETVLGELTQEQLDEMAYRAMDTIQEKIDTGELDHDLGRWADTRIDDEGYEYHIYEPSSFAEESTPVEQDQKEYEHEALPIYEISPELKEKVVFMLLTCYLAKDDYANAANQANILKQSDNKYYKYYGRYTDALTERKLARNTASAERKYTEAIAFFRNQTVKDATDTLATIFRARLYAEQGKFEKSRELANLLAEVDRKSIMDYIDQFKR